METYHKIEPVQGPNKVDKDKLKNFGTYVFLVWDNGKTVHYFAQEEDPVTRKPKYELLNNVLVVKDRIEKRLKELTGKNFEVVTNPYLDGISA